MKVLVGALTLVLATPAFAIDLFNNNSESRKSPKGPSLEQRVQLLERRINTISNIVLRLDSLQQEMQQLRGDVELQNHAMEGMKQRQNDLYTDIDQRISRITGEAPAMHPTQQQPGTIAGSVPPANTMVKQPTQPQTGQPTSAPSWESTPIQTVPGQQAGVVQAQKPAWPAADRAQPKPKGPSLPPVVSSTAPSGPATGQLQTTSVTVAPQPKPMPKPAVAPPRDTKGEKSSYQKAFNLLMDRKYDKAQQSFRTFLTKYPGSRLADNAQYWLAESNYVTRNFDVALTEFTKVVQVHPNSPKVSDALLKIGYIQYEQKQWGVAKETLGALVNRYPNSTASQLAKKRLDKMRAQGH